MMNAVIGDWLAGLPLRVLASPGYLCDSLRYFSRGPCPDAEAFQGFVGKRDSCRGHFQRGRRRPHLWRICGCPARFLPCDGGDVRRDARGRGRPPRPVAGVVSPTLWRSHTAHPPRRCARIFEPPSGMDDAASGREGREAPGRNHGDGSQPLLFAGGQPGY